MFYSFLFLLRQFLSVLHEFNIPLTLKRFSSFELYPSIYVGKVQDSITEQSWRPFTFRHMLLLLSFFFFLFEIFTYLNILIIYYTLKLQILPHDKMPLSANWQFRRALFRQGLQVINTQGGELMAAGLNSVTQAKKQRKQCFCLV